MYFYYFTDGDLGANATVGVQGIDVFGSEWDYMFAVTMARLRGQIRKRCKILFKSQPPD